MRRRDPIVVSVEHASSRVPAALADLGLPRRWLDGHHGWDTGAATVGAQLARELGGELHLGRWSRLVADLNRSEHHPRVVPDVLSPGARRIPANQALDPEGRQQRIDRFWRPYRLAVEGDLDRAVAERGAVLHISVHSFVERLGGEERRNHVGLLYDPAHDGERALADRLDHSLSALGFAVRHNYPYSGLDDGFCMRMRAERPWSTYRGMEIEMNQRLVRRPDGARRLGDGLVAAFLAACGGDVVPVPRRRQA